jgi:WD40 repeat protein
MATKRYVNFLEFHAPLLESGIYDVTLDQSLKIGNKTVLDPASLRKELYVQGKRFALEPNLVHSVYPYDGSQGDYSAVLPHIVLNRSILPWERSPLAGDAGPGVDQPVPWLALLVFDVSGENNAPVPKTISIEALYEASRGDEVVVPYFLAHPPASLEDLLEPEEKKEDPVTVLDVPKSVLEPVLPKYSDLPFSAHVRRTVDFKGKYVPFDTFFDKLAETAPANSAIAREEVEAIWEVLQNEGVLSGDERTSGAYFFPKLYFPADLALPEGATVDLDLVKATIRALQEELFSAADTDFAAKGEEKAYLVANRLARPNGQQEVHLVALFNCYEEDSKSFLFADASDDKPIRLIVFKSWSFTCEDAELDFRGLAKNLAVGNLRKSGVGQGSGAADKYLRAGFSMLPHRLRKGQSTISFYRGPLVPGALPTAAQPGQLPVETSDRLLRYETTTGLLDVSYAAAWELGRKLALSDPLFAKNLFLIKKRYIQQQQQRNSYPAINYLPVATELPPPPPLFQLHGHTAPITSLAYAKDGNLILSGSADDTAKLWRADTGALLFSFAQHSAAINTVAIAPGMDWALTGADDFRLIVWNLRSGKRMRTVSHSSAVRAVDIAADGSLAAVGLGDGTVRIYETEDFREVRRLQQTASSDGHTQSLTAVKMTQDGTRVVTGAGDLVAKIWDRTTGEVVFNLGGFSEGITAIAVHESADNYWIAVASSDGTVKLFDGNLGTEQQSMTTPQGEAVRSLAFAVEGTALLVATRNRILTADPEAGALEELVAKEAAAPALTAMQLSPSGQELLLGYDNNDVAVRRVADLEPVQTFFGGHTARITAIETNAELSLLITAAADGKVKLWDTATFQLLSTLTEHTTAVNSVAVSPDGEFFVTGSSQGRAIIWDAHSFEKRHELDRHSGGVNAVGFSSDGRTVYTASVDGTVQFRDVDSGESFRSFGQVGQGAITACVLSRDEAWLVTGADSGEVVVWDAVAGTPAQTISPSGAGTISALAISADNRWIGYNAADHSVAIYNREDGTEKVRLAGGHSDLLRDIHFTADGRRVLTVAADGHAIIWNAESGAVIHEEPAIPATLIGLLDEGRILKSVAANGAVQLTKTFADNGRFVKPRKGLQQSALRKVNEGPEDVLVAWLDKFNDLADIPFPYLIPDQDLLPAESLRFFRIDPYWIQCLKDGALSLADTYKPRGGANQLRSFWSEPVGLSCGFVLRSKLVSGFPDLEIRGYTESYSDRDTHPGGVAPRLVRRLSDQVLFCLFEIGSEIKTIDLFLPPGAVHFGFTEHKEVQNGREEVSYRKRYKDLYGQAVNGQFVLQPAHWSSERVIDLAQLISGGAQSLQAGLQSDAQISPEGKEEFAEFTSADFALAMLEGSPLVRISVAGG